MASHFSEKGYTRIGLLKTEATVYNVLTAELEKALKGRVTISSPVSYSTTDSDFKPTILKLKLATDSLDALGLYLSSAQLAAFARQAAELEFRVPLFGFTPFESKALLGHAQEFLKGNVYTHLKVSPGFRERYESRFKTDVQLSYAAHAYDVAVLLASITSELRGAPSGSDGWNNALFTGRTGKGVCGTHVLRENKEEGRYLSFETALKTVP